MQGLRVQVVLWVIGAKTPSFSDIQPRGADTRLKSTTVLKQCRHSTTLQSMKFYKFYMGMVKVKANRSYRHFRNEILGRVESGSKSLNRAEKHGIYRME